MGWHVFLRNAVFFRSVQQQLKGSIDISIVIYHPDVVEDVKDGLSSDLLNHWVCRKCHEVVVEVSMVSLSSVNRQTNGVPERRNRGVQCGGHGAGCIGHHKNICVITSKEVFLVFPHLIEKCDVFRVMFVSTELLHALTNDLITVHTGCVDLLLASLDRVEIFAICSGCISVKRLAVLQHCLRRNMLKIDNVVSLFCHRFFNDIDF